MTFIIISTAVKVTMIMVTEVKLVLLLVFVAAVVVVVSLIITVSTMIREVLCQLRGGARRIVMFATCCSSFNTRFVRVLPNGCEDNSRMEAMEDSERDGAT